MACGLLVEACGIQFPNQGSNLGPLHQEYGVLATGPPGKSILFLPLDFPFCFFCPAFPFFIPLFFVCFAVSSFFSSFVWVFSFFFFPLLFSLLLLLHLLLCTVSRLLSLLQWPVGQCWLPQGHPYSKALSWLCEVTSHFFGANLRETQGEVLPASWKRSWGSSGPACWG